MMNKHSANITNQTAAMTKKTAVVKPADCIKSHRKIILNKRRRRRKILLKKEEVSCLRS